MSNTKKKHLPKWRLSKYYHDKYFFDRDQKKQQQPDPVPLEAKRPLSELDKIAQDWAIKQGCWHPNYSIDDMINDY